MKLLTFRPAPKAADRVGVLSADEARVVDLSPRFRDMLALIDAGDAGLAEVRAARAASLTSFDLAEVQRRAPLPVPRQLRDAMTFELHYSQSIAAIARERVGSVGAKLATLAGIARIPPVWYQQPSYYKCNRFSVVGPDADVEWPHGSDWMDYECEIAVVIGKTGKDIPRERARDHIFGYTIFNDLTARDLQMREMQAHLGPAKGKDFDTGNVLGPWIVTRDALPDPYDLTCIARVNGEEWARSSSRDMHHRWEDLIAYISQNETLHAGEVIGSGTVSNGCGLELGRRLAPNAVIELEVSGLGTLRNRLVRA
jgi:2-keto-4-pentenoate hydratase/2-oxohepta-3-ene-1,7-dioic acid hydratase in catechol pathway